VKIEPALPSPPTAPTANRVKAISPFSPGGVAEAEPASVATPTASRAMKAFIDDPSSRGTGAATYAGSRLARARTTLVTTIQASISRSAKKSANGMNR
jgi:hypothetical protein